MSLTYPYNFFETHKNLSLDNIGSILTFSNVSILLNYKTEIKNFITSNKFNVSDLEKFNTLELISNSIFVPFLNNKEILTFAREIIIVKYKLKNYVKSIDDFLKLKELKIFGSYLIHSYKKNLLYKNPITASNIFDFDKNFIKDKIYISYNKNKDKLEKLLDIFFHGDYINLSLPSLGCISSYIEEPKILSSGVTILPKNFVNFIEALLLFFSNIDLSNNNSNLINFLPITDLDIDKVISNILINDVNIRFNNNNNIKNLIENNIKSINFSLNDFMFDVKTKKIKPEFLIPYKYDISKKTIVELKKNEISSKLKNLKDVVEYNFNIFYHVASEVFGDPANGIIGDRKFLDKPNYKNILACFLFFVINLLYEYYKEYIRKINNILIDISGSNNSKFGKLNIKDGFEFMTLLNKSLYKLRLLLFNNFYHFFIPGKTINSIYGMKKNEGGSYVPNSPFLIDNNYIFKNYPFNDVIKNIITTTPPKHTINFDIDKDKIYKFLVTIKSPSDIYDKEEKIELGGFAFTQEITMEGFEMIINFFKLYRNNCSFSEFVLDLVYRNFTDDKKIPIELLLDITDHIISMRSSSSMTRQENKDRLVYLITKLYSENISYATKLFIKLNEIVKKIKKNHSSENLNYTEQREIIKLAAVIYYFKAIAIDNICKKFITDVKVKNQVIIKIDQIRRDNEKILSKLK